jgi:hypothetical protein
MRSPYGPIPDDIPRSLETELPAFRRLWIATLIGVAVWGLLWPIGSLLLF